MPKNCLDYCKDCGIKLKNTKHLRTYPKLCPDCRGYHQSTNVGVREICKELKKKNENLPDDDDWSALDCPKAVKEVEYGRVVRKSNVTAHETTLSEIII